MRQTKFAILASEKDEAGMNIACELEKLNFQVNYFDKEIIYAEASELIWQNIDADFIIFASKHQGKQERMLSIHTPGNWKKADLGGKDGRVCLTSARIMKIFFQELKNNIPLNWQATMECTHHGPLIDLPCLFIEIGSNEADWKDKEAGKAIARTIKSAIKLINQQGESLEFEAAIGIGGPHYCPNFNKIQANSRYAISHIIPEYSLPLTREMIEEAILKTEEPVKLILLDWKGIKGEQRQQIIQIIESLCLKWRKTSEIEK